MQTGLSHAAVNQESENHAALWQCRSRLARSDRSHIDAQECINPWHDEQREQGALRASEALMKPAGYYKIQSCS